jgi:hypothetical protein
MPSCLPLRPLQAFGEVRSLFTAAKGRGFVAVSYFDTRAATLAKHTLAGQVLSGQQLDVHFSLPKDDREAAQVGGCTHALMSGRAGWLPWLLQGVSFARRHDCGAHLLAHTGQCG